MAISRISGVPLANIAKVNGVAIANVEKVSGVEKEAGVGPTVYIHDTFTDADDTAIIGRTPDTVDQGAAWYEVSTSDTPPTIQNNAWEGSVRNRCGIDPTVSDLKVTGDILSLARGSSTRAVLAIRNTTTGSTATWETRFLINNNNNPRIDLVELGTIRDTATFADNYEPGSAEMVGNGQTITARYQSPSHDVSVSYTSSLNQTVTECTLGSNGLCRWDNYKIEDP